MPVTQAVDSAGCSARQDAGRRVVAAAQRRNSAAVDTVASGELPVAGPVAVAPVRDLSVGRAEKIPLEVVVLEPVVLEWVLEEVAE